MTNEHAIAVHPFQRSGRFNESVQGQKLFQVGTCTKSEIRFGRDTAECLELFTRPGNKVSTCALLNLRAIKVVPARLGKPGQLVVDSNGLNLSRANTVLTGISAS